MSPKHAQPTAAAPLKQQCCSASGGGTVLRASVATCRRKLAASAKRVVDDASSASHAVEDRKNTGGTFYALSSMESTLRNDATPHQSMEHAPAMRGSANRLQLPSPPQETKIRITF